MLDYDDLLLYWAQMMASAAIAADVAARFDFVLVDEYQDTNALQAEILLKLKPDGRGLTVVGDDAQAIYGFRAATVRNILDFPSQFEPPAAVLRARAELPLDPADPGRRQRGDRPGARGVHQEPVLGAARSPQKPVLATVRDEAEPGRLRRRGRCWRTARRASPCASRRCCSAPSHHSGRLELELARRNIPFVKYGGLKFLEAAHVKDVLAILRWAENPRDRDRRLPRPAAAARHRPRHRAQGAGRCWRPATSTSPRSRAAAAARQPPSCGRLWSSSCATLAGAPDVGRASWSWSAPSTIRCSRSCTIIRRARLADLDQLARIAGELSVARALPDRAHPRSARGGRRRGRRAAARRGLSDPLDHPLGQGPGVAGGVRAERRRRLHPLRHGDRHGRGDRGGAPRCSTSP